MSGRVDLPPSDEGELDGLLERSQLLQTEIGAIFAKFCDINRQLRIDIDDFCDICDNSIANATNANVEDSLQNENSSAN